MYWSIENFVLYTLMPFSFFQIFIFCIFSAHYYMMLLSDFREIFFTYLNWSKALPKQSEKLTRDLVMIVLMNALSDVGLRNFVPEILASKLSL